MLIVQVCDFGNDGDAQYRLHDPSRFLGRLPGVTAIDCHFYHRHLHELTEIADVVVLQFVNDWELLSLCERRRATGKVTIFEANDFFFDLQPWNPIAARWLDRSIQEMYLQLLTAADGVQTSTEELARRWRERGARQVKVFANHLTEIAPLPPVPNRPLTVGWAGSPGHFADWFETAPLLGRWLAEHPEVRLAVMTHELAKPFFHLSPERHSFTSFSSLSDYMRFLRSLDIGLAPLLPTGYNRCRSDVKFLEYAAQGVVGIYSDLEPYRATVKPGETGLLYRTAEELIDSLERLRTDLGLRQKLRGQAYAYVERGRRLGDHIGDRLAWYQSLLPGQPRTEPLPSEIIQAASRDAGYLRLAPQDPEHALLEALKKETPKDATSLLSRVLERNPRFLPALKSQGQFLNDQRDHRAALTYLEQARAIEPTSARTLSEIGRAWFRLGDDAKAQAALTEAVRVHPHYLPGWQYLLRLLSLNKSPDGPRWAARAEGLFPLCYSLALLGIQTYPPAQAAGQVLRLLEHFAPSFSREERPLATSAFRQAIVTLVQTGPFGPEVISLLRKTCEVFPHSARLAAELAAALHRAGMAEEAYQHYARAWALRRQANLYQEEFPREEGPPYLWQFADHIRLHRGDSEF